MQLDLFEQSCISENNSNNKSDNFVIKPWEADNNNSFF